MKNRAAAIRINNGPGSAPKYIERSIEEIPPKIPMSAERNRNELKDDAIFLLTAAGIIITEPISKVPTSFIPTATANANIKRKTNSTIEGFIPIERERSSEIKVSANLFEKSSTKIIIAKEIIRASQKSMGPSFVIFPKSASKISSGVARRAPNARASVKKTPTTVSTGSFVLFSTNQIKTVPKTKKAIEPKNKLK